MPNVDTPNKGEKTLVMKATIVVKEVVNMALAARRYTKESLDERSLNELDSEAFHASMNTNTSSAPIPRIINTERTWKMPI